MRSILSMLLFSLAASAPALAIEPVSVPAFRSLELRGGGTVTVVPAAVQHVTLVEGSSQYARFRVDPQGKLVIDACDGSCPRNYQLRIRIESPRIEALAVNGGGSISTANGFAPQGNLGVAINGGGKIDARSIDAGTVGAAVSGGGQILVHARSMLGAAVRGGGEIVYWGSPAVAPAIHGGGSVHRGG